jgi:hypothetical protein
MVFVAELTGMSIATVPERWSRSVRGLVPVPVDARVLTLTVDERPTDAARKSPVGQHVENLQLVRLGT